MTQTTERVEVSMDAPSLGRARKLMIVRGVLAVLLGIVMLVLLMWKPVDEAVVVGLLVGVFFLAAGLMRVVTAIAARGMDGGMKALNIILGALVAVLGGFAIWMGPAFGLVAAAFMVGFAWMLEGVAMLVQLPPEGRGWWIAGGVISIIAGLVIVWSPFWAVYPLLMVGAVALLIVGVMDLVNSSQIAQAEKVAQPF
jgi:uncharacterized membrane protein HdeD (DUF308 family)